MFAKGQKKKSFFPLSLVSGKNQINVFLMFNIFIYFTCLQVILSHIVLLHQERHFVLEGDECASVGGEGVSVR